jgi:DNA polymerase I-like protein with 3'-5' exonuclease and polymerase domains
MDLPDACYSKFHSGCKECRKTPVIDGVYWSNIYKSRMSEATREGFNFKIQSACADLLKIALVIMHQYFDAIGLPLEEGLVAVIHDEVLMHVRKKNEAVVRKIIVHSFSKAGREILKRIPITCEIGSGSNWYQAKKMSADPTEEDLIFDGVLQRVA